MSITTPGRRLSRREFVILAALARSTSLPAAATTKRFGALPARFAQLETANGGRLGVTVLDTGTGERAGQRENERFAMCSSFKFLLAAAVLQKAERHEESLDRLRQSLPPGWRAADKTGSNGEHTCGDIAVFWPPEKSPVIVAAYITQCPGPEAKRAALLAEVGRLVATC